MVDPRTAGLISLIEHEKIVEELTEVLKNLADVVGPELMPAKKGYDWFDALEKHAPDKAAVFAQTDPTVDIFPYAVLVYNDKEKQTLMDSSVINMAGVFDLLSTLTKCTVSNREHFAKELKEKGHSKFYARENQDEIYSIFAVDRNKYAMDSRGVLIKLDRFGRASMP